MTNDSLDDKIDRATNVLALVADLSVVMMAAPDGGPELSSDGWLGLSEVLTGLRRQLQQAQTQVPNVVTTNNKWTDPEAPKCAQTLRELADLHERFFAPQTPEVPA